MLYLVFADVISVTKDILTVVGGIGALTGIVFGIWFARRKFTESKRQQERKDDIEFSTKFVRLETTVNTLQTAADSLERQYTEFRETAQRDQKELVKQIDNLRTRCTDHQQASDVKALQQDVQRIKDQLKELDQEFSRHRDLVAEKYLTLASYQNDLIMWTKTFDDLRQSLRDVHLTLSKRGR